jgi:hypothetical protein
VSGHGAESPGILSEVGSEVLDCVVVVAVVVGILCLIMISVGRGEEGWEKCVDFC